MKNRLPLKNVSALLSRPVREPGAGDMDFIAARGGRFLGRCFAAPSPCMPHHQPRMKPRDISQPCARRHAFTRVELLACVAALALLAALALPALATTSSRSHVVQCLNNLRLVGRGVQMWAAEHTDQVPWRTAGSQGGEYTGSLRLGIAWGEFALLSNQLATPRILACPADVGVNVASAWTGPDTYTAIQFRANATSYFLNLHTLSELPLAPLCGDRNIRTFASGPCGLTSVNNVASVDSLDPNLGWTNAVHGLAGNIVTMDGSAVTTTSTELRAAFARSEDENGSPIHLLRAR